MWEIIKLHRERRLFEMVSISANEGNYFPIRMASDRGLAVDEGSINMFM